MSSYFQGSQASTITASEGDTLSSLAASLWGDASLWWKLAEANGYSKDATLTEGQIIRVPTGVVRSTYNASTFTPYDPAEIIGNVSPTTTKPPKNKKNGCGGLGVMIMVIIAIVVAVKLGPRAAEFIARFIPKAIPGTAALIASGETVAGANAATWAAASAGTAVGGAAGSAVSQVAGMAMGVQEKFSWNAVALSAIGAGVGVGMAATGWHSVARGIAGSVITQGIGVATGLQEKFSWAGVAAAGIGAGVFSKVSSMLPAGMGDTARITVASGAQLIADAASRSLIEGTDFGDNVLAALPNAIASVVASGIAGRGSGTTGSAKVGSTPKNAKEVVAACHGVTDLQDPRVKWEEDPESMNYVRPEDRARAEIVRPGDMPVVEAEEIVVTGTRRANPLAGYVPYELRPESERTYASAAPPSSYWGDVGNRMQMGWNNAWANFRHELGGPTSVEDVFRRSADPYGTRYITSALNLAFEPLSDGVAEMSRPLFPDGDGEWLYIQQNREHPFLLDPQHVTTGQDRRNVFGYGAVTLATMRVPFGRARVAAAQELNAARIADDIPFGTAELPEGSFSIADWWRYPDGYPRPPGPFRVIEGAEYEASRDAADAINDTLRTQWGLRGRPVEIHEIHPVKFGGSPTDLANKLVVSRDVHRQELTPWWNQLQRHLGG